MHLGSSKVKSSMEADEARGRDRVIDLTQDSGCIDTHRSFLVPFIELGVHEIQLIRAEFHS